MFRNLFGIAKNLEKCSLFSSLIFFAVKLLKNIYFENNLESYFKISIICALILENWNKDPDENI